MILAIASIAVALVVVLVTIASRRLAEMDRARAESLRPDEPWTPAEPSHIRACTKCGSRPSYTDDGEPCVFCDGVYAIDGKDGTEPEPAPLPTPADLDPQVELADLLARANHMAGGKYLAINVGPSRHERRAAKAQARRAKR